MLPGPQPCQKSKGDELWSSHIIAGKCHCQVKPAEKLKTECREGYNAVRSFICSALFLSCESRATIFNDRWWTENVSLFSSIAFLICVFQLPRLHTLLQGQHMVILTLTRASCWWRYLHLHAWHWTQRQQIIQQPEETKHSSVKTGSLRILRRNFVVCSVPSTAIKYRAWAVNVKWGQFCRISALVITPPTLPFSCLLALMSLSLYWLFS